MASRQVLSREDAYSLMSESLIVDEVELRREFTRRADIFEHSKVAHSDVPELAAKGWEPYQELKRQSKLRRRKRLGAQLEDDVWCLFRRAGYHELNRKLLYVPFER